MLTAAGLLATDRACKGEGGVNSSETLLSVPGEQGLTQKSRAEQEKKIGAALGCKQLLL